MKYRKPKRIFEDSGSVNPEQSYYVPLENVTNTKKQDIKTMVDMGRYFSIFAPRQSGKTTVFKRICSELQKDPIYAAIVLSFDDYSSIDKTEFYSLLEKTRFIKAFFKEVNAYEDLSLQEYALPGNRLDMKRILLNFERYVSQIGVRAFYSEEKPYEKTGQFLLTAWLYQFVKGEQSDLRYEVLSGLGRLDIMLTYKGKKYIIETKVNRHDDVSGIIEEGVQQLSGKYLATENTTEGYLVVFNTRVPVGTGCEPQTHQSGDKQVISFTIAIGKPT
jgi:hypothetical protein